MKISIAVTGQMKPLVFVMDAGSPDGKKFVGRLYDVEAGTSWKACSGPYGKGAAPKGVYYLARPVAINPEAEENKPYKDKAGNAWFARLDPQFPTDRVGLGVHPDGNVPGTLGCIGIMEDDTKELFEMLYKMDHPVMVFVV